MFEIIYVLSILLELAFVPLFLKYSWPEKCWKSFRLKMVCSSLFLIAALCCMKIADNTSRYALMMLSGLILGWFGDLFLHLITDKMVFFGIGLLSFLAGHVFYVIAFLGVQREYFPETPAFTPWELGAIALIVVCMVTYAIVTKMKLGVAAVPVAMYLVTISVMLIKALSLCARFGLMKPELFPWTTATMGIGAVLFVLSDSTLALLLFGGKKSNRPLKIFNIGTYFAGQLLLASTILLGFTTGA